MAWYCKAHKIRASVKIRLSASVALALCSRIPAGIRIRVTMTHYATAMSYPGHTATFVCAILPGKHKCPATVRLHFSATPLSVIQLTVCKHTRHDSCKQLCLAPCCQGTKQQLQSVPFCKAVAVYHDAHGLLHKVCLGGDCTPKALAVVV